MAEVVHPNDAKIRTTITSGDPAEAYRRIRAKTGQYMCPLCNRIFNEHSDDELNDCVGKLAEAGAKLYPSDKR
jgi:hypothetical protein